MRTRGQTVVMVAAMAAALGDVLPAAQPATYAVRSVSIEDLGTLGGLESGGNDINAWGAVVGWSLNSAGRERAFIAGRGSPMRDLGGSSSYLAIRANAINYYGTVVGTVTLPRSSGPMSAAARFTADGTLTFLEDRLRPLYHNEVGCRFDSSAQDIADTGHIVGSVWLAGRPTSGGTCSGGRPPVLWLSPASPTVVPGTDYRDEWGVALNNRDAVVGTHFEFAHSAARWNRGVTTIVPPPADSGLENARPSRSATPSWTNTVRLSCRWLARA